MLSHQRERGGEEKVLVCVCHDEHTACVIFRCVSVELFNPEMYKISMQSDIAKQ